MKDVDQALDTFVGCIKESETYLRYMQERKKLELFPDLKRKIDEYRKQMYMLQKSGDGGRLFDEVERIEAESASLRDNRLASDFLASELALCRMMQNVYTKITAELEFDITLSGSET